MPIRLLIRLWGLGLVAVPGPCLADFIQVVDQDFNAPLAEFALQTNSSANATADIFVADVASSQGVVYAGTWDITPGSTEFSSGSVSPLLPPAVDYQIEPGEVDGIRAISYTVDVVLNGFPGDTVDNLFLVLFIFQENDQGQIDVYSQRGVTTLIDNMTLQTVTVDLTVDDFENFLGSNPDLGPDARPISFGIQLGALFDSKAFTGTQQGHLSIDNWQVVVEVPDRILRDRFEAN